MLMTRRGLIVVVALIVAAATWPARAQEPTVAQGQLVRVDLSAKTIVIRTEAVPQMTFSFTDDTKVIGASDDVAGLATMSGTRVAVYFTRVDQMNVATRIEVQKK